MKKRVFDTVKKHSLIETYDNVLIGLSGGADSMALLYILLELQEEMDFNILVAHVNHGVRGDDAKRDQKFVKDQAEKLNLPYYTKDVDMVGYGKEKGITSEEAGRELRYGFFRDILKSVGGGKVAVAHNKNDQAETLIMRFMRGTGVDGLKGMEYIAGDIIRPILGIDRADIERYIETNNIEIVTDMTNFQNIYNRNKIRLELIPYIEENFNPSIIEAMWRMSEISSIDSDFLNVHSEKIYEKNLKIKDDEKIVLDAKGFEGIHPSMSQRIIRKSILEFGSSLQGISEAQISNVMDLIEKKETGKEVHLSNNILIRTNYDEIIIQMRRREDKKDYNYEIDYPGLVNFQNIGYSFNIEVLSREQYAHEKKASNTSYFDLDKISGPLRVRNRKNGDRFVPFGMRGSKKIKDYFIDEKIPKDLRDKIPLIVDKESIIWVIGYRTDEKHKISDKTRNILKVSYSKI